MIDYINMTDDPYKFFPYEFFKLGKVMEGYKEIGEFFCTLQDRFDFKLIMFIVEMEDTLMISLRHGENHAPLFDIKIQHYVKSIARDKDTLKILRYCDVVSLIEFSFEPNFSLNLTKLSTTKNPTSQMLECPMVFCQRALVLLFEREPVADEAGNISFSKTNSEGFTLFITVLPNVRKCFAKLTFVHYQDPAFQATFTDIVAIDCDLTAEGRGLIIKGQQESEVVKILFNPTFSIVFGTRTFYGKLL